MNFSEEYLIYEDKIINKKQNRCYKINKGFYEDLKKSYITKQYAITDEELSYLLNKGILQNEKTIYDPFVKNKGLPKDFRLFIQVTNQCNLHCAHCYANSGVSYVQYFDEEKLFDVVREACYLGISRIDFTGGEVFTQKYFMSFLDKLDKYPVSYSIFTNLTLLNRKQIDQISNLKGLYRIVTSIDYFNAKKHDEFRGVEGSYKKTIDTLLSLKDKGVEVVVNSIVNNDNHEDIISLMHFLKEHDIELHLDTIIECGRAKNYSNTGNVIENVRFIRKLLKDNINDLDEDRISRNVCGVGENFIFLDYLGYYNLCTGLNRDVNERFNLGKILKDAIPKIYSFDLQCDNKKCIYSKNKSCGCRHRAYVNHSELNKPDDLICQFISTKD
jgi:MoaA/NifB/PqqE/SkfB family radical SAM enzyme